MCPIPQKTWAIQYVCCFVMYWWPDQAVPCLWPMIAGIDTRPIPAIIIELIELIKAIQYHPIFHIQSVSGLLIFHYSLQYTGSTFVWMRMCVHGDLWMTGNVCLCPGKPTDPKWPQHKTYILILFILSTLNILFLIYTHKHTVQFLLPPGVLHEMNT